MYQEKCLQFMFLYIIRIPFYSSNLLEKCGLYTVKDGNITYVKKISREHEYTRRLNSGGSVIGDNRRTL